MNLPSLRIALGLTALVCLIGCGTGPKEPRTSKRPMAAGAAKDIKPKEGGPVVKPETVLEGDDNRRSTETETSQPLVTRKEPVADSSPIVERKRPPLISSPLLVPEFRQPTEQEVAAMALGRIGRPAVPSLIRTLSNRDPQVRKQAALVLARIGPDAADAVPELKGLLDDPDEEVRKAAARALGQIGPAAADAVPALMRQLVEPKPELPRR